MAKTRKLKSANGSTKRTPAKKLEEVAPEPEETEVDVEVEEKPKPKVRQVRRTSKKAKAKLRRASKLVYMGESFIAGREYPINGEEKIKRFKDHGQFIVDEY